MDRLEAVVQPYDWGSRYVIATLQGRPTPSPGPEAELWIGAHPGAPALLEREQGLTTLHRVIAADPEQELGVACASRFDGRLPFLLKVLAVEKALSIQVHPDRAQAQEGWSREDAASIPLRDPARNYKDDWPKPEAVLALTEFEALAGFRSVEEAARIVEHLQVPALATVVDALRSGEDQAQVRALTTLLHWPMRERDQLLADVEWRCGELADDPGVADEDRAAFRAAVRIARQHPGDIGLVASLLLQHVTLSPGEGLFMPAGGLHCYLQGTGIELLANSDNVVRAGLTSKHVDVDELLRLLDPAVTVPTLRPVEVAPGLTHFETPAPEFDLLRCTVGEGGATAGGRHLPGDGAPRLLLCLEGEVTVTDDAGDQVVLGRGESCYSPATDSGLVLTGRGDVVIGTTGR
ncbi:mannose-6-phosphate isomerase, class I [Arsenicicoccus cauae]|uniref:mannose-6-phosphate isomerase n=1 Tax=Arsenicicoccus cauae TaxID=2663847 RepID=A0A6I3IGG4_9MICO|nr:mannose-6-phosphate isomerase, class I [Arsenicicoccus cauae]MTB73142.1 mannose-6-phosphate isomerase, class I [Arsenicicoccus cauae]